MAWSFDKRRKVWKCTSYGDLNYAAINNFAEYGQPVSPYEKGFDHEHNVDFAKIVIEMTQLQVMTQGYGRNITADEFPVSKKFLNKKLDLAPGKYSFAQLVKLGFCGDSDRWIKSNLYGWGGYGIDSGTINSGDAKYIHGTVSFALRASTTFTYDPPKRTIVAEIGAGDDNWDFNSSSIPKIANAVVATLLGPDHYNLEAPIKFIYTGPGKMETVSNSTDPWF